MNWFEPLKASSPNTNTLKASIPIKGYHGDKRFPNIQVLCSLLFFRVMGWWSDLALNMVLGRNVTILREIEQD